MDKIIRTPLSSRELKDAASNYLNGEHWDIPPTLIDRFIAEAAEEYLENFCTNPVVSPEIQTKIARAIDCYRQESGLD